jgi:hypothetical protein
MTTKHSPLRVLKQQSDTIASVIKAAERGEKVGGPFAAKIEAARSLPSFKVGIVMDDKIITLEIAWAIVRETSQVGLAEYILNQMKETRNVIN